jgi:hypothetical protein
VLKQTEAERQIEAQRLEQVFTSAMREANTIGRTQPLRAVQLLQEASALIAADTTALKAERRTELLRLLKNETSTWSQRADIPPVTPGPVTQPPRRDPPGTADSKSQFDKAKERFDRDNKIKGDLELAKGERAKADLALANLIAKAAIPEYRDMTYPADWDLKMKRTSGVKMTEQEKAILKTLGATFTAEYKDLTFKDVIDDLQKRTGLPIVVDQRALEEANVKYDSTINLSLRGVTTRTVLKRLLADLSLTYVVKDQAVQITTPARAKEMLSVRAYSVADLMPAVDMRMPFALSRIQAYQTLQQIVVLITQTVEPDSWEVNGKGGLGTIVFDPTRFMLIVRQTAEVHYLMGLTGR